MSEEEFNSVDNIASSEGNCVPDFKCDFLDLRHFVELAFQTGKTPLVIDTSSDEKVCTYYSYQTDSILLEAKSMIIQQSTGSLQSAMEIGRRALANSMRHGKTLIIRMGQSAPDFRNTLNDHALQRKYKNLDFTHESFFPEEVFVEAGRQLHGDCPQGLDWAKRIMRAEDMLPHKNIAICRNEFRVMLVTQLPLENIDEFLFGDEWGGLPLRNHFVLIQITHEDDDDEQNKTTKSEV